MEDVIQIHYENVHWKGQTYTDNWRSG